MELRDVNMKSQGSFPDALTARAPLNGESLLARLTSSLGPRYTAFVVLLAILLSAPLAMAAYEYGGTRQRNGAGLWMLGLN